MAEYKTGVQVNYGFGLSFQASGKAPIIAKQIWATLADAQAYVDSETDTATAGLMLVVCKDTTAANNGVYRVVKAAGEDGNIKGQLVKLTEGGDIPDVDALIKAAIAALDAEKSGSAAGTTVKVTETDGKISAVEVSHTKGAVAAGDTNLVDGATVKTYVDTAISGAVGTSFKVKGCKDNYTDLPTTGNQVGDVWNIKNEFTIEGEGKYPAGSNVVWVDEHKDGSTTHAAHWDVLGGTYDLSVYKTKQDAVTVSGLAAGKTITALSQDANGQITATASNIAITQSQVTGLETALAGKVPTTRKVNDKTLDEDVVLTGADVKVDTTAGAKTVATAISDLTTIVGNKADDELVLKKNQVNTLDVNTEFEISDEESSFIVSRSGNSVYINGDSVEVSNGVNIGSIKPDQITLGVTEQTAGLMYNEANNCLELTATNSEGITEGQVILKGVDSPTDNHDAANKLYVDTTVGNTKKSVSNNKSTAVKGVTVQVDQTDNAVAKPVITIADGSVASGNTNLVTGGVVYTAVENAKTAMDTKLTNALTWGTWE